MAKRKAKTKQSAGDKPASKVGSLPAAFDSFMKSLPKVEFFYINGDKTKWSTRQGSLAATEKGSKKVKNPYFQQPD